VHVALNLVFLVPGETGGMETYARELIPPLAALGIRVTALVNREAAAAGGGPWGEVVPIELVPIRARNRLEWVRGEQQYVPRLAQAAGADLVHSLGSTAPFWGRVPRVTTVHDLNYKLVPEAHFGVRGLAMRGLVPLAVRRSRRVIVDAESTRRDLLEHLGTPSGKVDVVPLGVTPPPPVEPPIEETLRAGLGLGARPVVLSVSAKRPHKNLPRLLHAIAGIPAERRPALVIPGYRTPHEEELRALAAELGLDVVFPHWITPAELEGLYSLATCVVFPSLYEGFGLPVLEAMARGVPVACSSRSSLPEVAGDAALLFDPTDVDAIRAATERLLGDAALRQRLALAGRERASRFTWDATARGTREAYERALRRSGHGGGQ
jgi:glycosyltransferase involved in cell wall biosynthesis